MLGVADPTGPGIPRSRVGAGAVRPRPTIASATVGTGSLADMPQASPLCTVGVAGAAEFRHGSGTQQAQIGCPPGKYSSIA
jgi:hypothetical protein